MAVSNVARVRSDGAAVETQPAPKPAPRVEKQSFVPAVEAQRAIETPSRRVSPLARKRAEDALHDSQTRTRLLIQS